MSTVAGYVDRMAGLIVLQNDVVETAHRLMDSREWETVQRLQSELWARIARLRKFEIANQLSVNDFKKHVGY